MASHQIVIIGASFGALPVAHSLLKDVLPPLAASKKMSYKVIMISPSDHFYWKVGSPRTLINPKALPVEKTLLPILESFKAYNAEQFEFIKAYADSIDPLARTVQIDTSASIHYDSLIIASGTDFNSALWTVAQGTDTLRKALQDLHTRLPTAETVFVAGGGPAGVETAGELGETYGNKKDITLLSGQAGLLYKLQNKKIGQDAEARLVKMGVKVINGDIRVKSSSVQGSKTILELTNGETRTVDVYIDATGDRPNSGFVPTDWLDQKQKVKTDPNTLRLAVPNVTGVYCIGAVGSYSNGSLFDTMFGYKAILESIRSDLEGNVPGPRTKNIYKKWEADMQFVPIGSNQGVGAIFGYKAPSFLVKMAKSRDYMIGNAAKVVAGQV